MALLQLKNITCVKKQDSVSKDEPYIKLNGDNVYAGSGFKKDVSCNLLSTNPYQFNDRVTMELYEKDRGSRDDFLGQVVISNTPQGERSARFNERAGADYVIRYEVLAN